MTTQTKPKIHIVIENEQPTTTSRNVAENFNKRHKHVLEAIDELVRVAENSADLFYENYYTHPQNKQQYREYYMTKDGFILLAMGFTGKKALEFKLAYIDQFNKMEEHIKQQQIDTSKLSPELQMFGNLYKAIANQELETKRLESKVDGISELIAMDSKDWRAEVVAILRRIAIKQGGFDKYSEVTNESYIRLEAKGRCNLNTRLENRKKNMIAQGLGKTAVSKLNNLDVIQEDHRLKEIYVSVVKDMAIKYEVWEG